MSFSEGVTWFTVSLWWKDPLVLSLDPCRGVLPSMVGRADDTNPFSLSMPVNISSVDEYGASGDPRKLFLPPVRPKN